MEERFGDVLQIQVKMKFCDNCHNGYMKLCQDELLSLTQPPQYLHICETCGIKKYFKVIYPCFEF